MSVNNPINVLHGLTTEHLVELSSGHQLHHQVIDDFKQLQQAASEQGFDLQIVSSFRHFDRQLAIWNAKFCGARPIFDLEGKQVDIKGLSDWQICQAIMIFSALPGASRHHWGTDLDFYDANNLPPDYELQLTSEEYDHHGPCAALSHWLMANAEQYQFFFPYRHYLGGIACEPWHISYYPLAEQFQQQMTTGQLASILSTADIEGKTAILSNLSEIFERYISNINIRENSNE